MPTQRSLIIGAALLFGAVAPGCVEDSEEIGDREPRRGEACDEVGAQACDPDTDEAIVCTSEQTWQFDGACYCDANGEFNCAVPGFVGLQSAQRPVATRTLRNTA